MTEKHILDPFVEGARMRKVAVWVLSVSGVIGLLLALTFEAWNGPNGPEFRMGCPDSWVIWESTPNGGHRSEVNFLRWSVLILVASVYALSYAVRLRRRKTTEAEPGDAPEEFGKATGPINHQND